MANSFVQLNTGTGGAKAQTYQNTVGANVVDANAVVLTDASGNSISTLPVNAEGTKATYSVTNVLITPAAAATDILTITGSASKIIRIKRVAISGGATTAGTILVALIRRSSANTGGTSTAPSKGSFDTTDPAASATVAAYSANPTALGTTVANIETARLFLAVTTTSVPQRLDLDYSTRNSKAIVLRGTSDILALSLLGSTIPAGGTVDYTIEWTEE